MSLVWSPGFNGVTDPDAQTYIAAVEAADTEAIEGDVALAINDFVVGCKLDGIWDAIKSSCILAGARTLSGALVPLKGTAPTNNNFVSGDYDRETGLVGNGSNKWLDSNRNNNADPQNSKHIAIYADSVSNNSVLISCSALNQAGDSYLYRTSTTSSFRNNSSSSQGLTGTFTSGFYGTSRSISTSAVARKGSTSTTYSLSSATPFNSNLFVFGRVVPTNARLSFYSIGESLNLALLDARVSTLMTDIGAAIT